MDYAKESLRLHGEWKGKIEMVNRVPVKTKDDLSLAYTPGVAQPCLEIQKDVDKSYELTRRSNLVAVVTDGTGVAADIEGYEVCGKTSTAEIASEEGGYKKEVYNIGFCGFIDNSSSNLVCFVGANEVYAMRQTTQIFNDIMENAVKQYNITSMPSN